MVSLSNHDKNQKIYKNQKFINFSPKSVDNYVDN